jgi:hypothetical protein
MRAASGLPLLMIAARLGADQATIAALESGDSLALPEVQETTRIVSAYGRMVGIDPTIALHRIAILREEAGAPQRQSATGAQSISPAMQPAQSRAANTATRLDASTGGWIAPSQNAPGHGGGLAQMQMQPHARAEPNGPAIQRSGQHRGQSNAAIRPPRLAVHSAQPQYSLPEPTQILPRSLPAQENWMPPAPIQRQQTQTPLPYAQHSMVDAGGRPAAVTNLSAVNPLQPPERPARSENDTIGRRAASRAATSRVRSSPVDDGVETSRRRHPARVALKYVTVPMMVVAGLWYTVQNPTAVHAALAHLPEPLPRMAKAGMEIVLVNTVPAKDGLRMITANDPRSRKADKLQVRREANK